MEFCKTVHPEGLNITNMPYYFWIGQSLSMKYISLQFFFQKIDFRFSFQKIDSKSTFSFGNVYHPQGCPDLKKWSHSWRYGYQFTFKAKYPFCEPITISWDVLLMIENPLPHPAWIYRNDDISGGMFIRLDSSIRYESVSITAHQRHETHSAMWIHSSVSYPDGIHS